MVDKDSILVKRASYRAQLSVYNKTLEYLDAKKDCIPIRTNHGWTSIFHLKDCTVEVRQRPKYFEDEPNYDDEVGDYGIDQELTLLVVGKSNRNSQLFGELETVILKAGAKSILETHERRVNYNPNIFK